jgi:Ca2+-binding RTX toxin-like protein
MLNWYVSNADKIEEVRFTGDATVWDVVTLEAMTGSPPTNSPPVNTVPGTQSATEDTVKVISGISVSDVDSSSLTMTLTVTNGTISVNGGVAGGATVGGNGTAAVTLTGSQGAINATLAVATGVTYNPAFNFNGAATLTVTSNDGIAGDSDNITINVAAVNDPPTLANPLADQNAAVGTPFGYTVPANSFADADSTLAHSASRADDTSLPAWLTFTPGTRAFSGTPTANDAGVLSVKVTASDGQAGVFDIFTITIPNNVINGTAGNDTVNGTAGYDTVSGLAGNDILNGLDGNDILDGGSGTDTLNGGNGDDAFLIVGADSSYDTVNGGSGFDVILGRTSSDTDTFRLTSATGIERIDGGGGTGVNVIVVGGGAGGTLDLSGVELVNILNQIYGGGTADTITDALGRDELIDGGGGNDTLNGLDGNDTLIGNAGNDTLNGGAGVDTLTGGTGDDVLAFQQGQAQGDTVQDFAGANAPGGDLLRFTGFGAGATLTYTGANNAWLISYGAQSETITLVGVTALNSSDYLFVG